MSNVNKNNTGTHNKSNSINKIPNMSQLLKPKIANSNIKSNSNTQVTQVSNVTNNNVNSNNGNSSNVTNVTSVTNNINLSKTLLIVNLFY